jgi:hypothetical protein
MPRKKYIKAGQKHNLKQRQPFTKETSRVAPEGYDNSAEVTSITATLNAVPPQVQKEGQGMEYAAEHTPSAHEAAEIAARMARDAAQPAEEAAARARAEITEMFRQIRCMSAFLPVEMPAQEIRQLWQEFCKEEMAIEAARAASRAQVISFTAAKEMTGHD